MLVFWFLQLELWAEAPGIVTPRSVAGSLGWEEPPLFPAVFLGCAHPLVGCLWESCTYFPSHKCKSLYSVKWHIVLAQNFTKKMTSYKVKRNQCTNKFAQSVLWKPTVWVCNVQHSQQPHAWRLTRPFSRTRDLWCLLNSTKTAKTTLCIET